jgi:histidinol-phosphate/aromatic aminotransferase/cobyric acid decarboxylase-like protein
VELFAALDRDDRRTLLAFAEFLAASGATRAAPDDATPELPRDLPRPDDESVVAALKRLRRTYPMLDSAPLLDAAARLVTAHVLHGRGADEVIDELETLFAEAYAGHAVEAEGRA